VPVVALVTYVAFIAVALGLRIWIHYQRTGDHGLRILSGGRGPAFWLPGALLITGVLLAGVAPVAQVLGLVEPYPPVNAPAFHWAGLLLGLCGIAVTLVSQQQMGNSWRVGVDAHETTGLITVGLFSIVRNPIFTGMALAVLGLLMMSPNFLAVVSLVSLLVAIEMQVRWIEEPYLTRVHGARYLSYARAVGRFLPWIGRMV
jgi:protein-S-isoprenylcysteine O-methyltransferase Ste14